MGFFSKLFGKKKKAEENVKIHTQPIEEEVAAEVECAVEQPPVQEGAEVEAVPTDASPVEETPIQPTPVEEVQEERVPKAQSTKKAKVVKKENASEPTVTEQTATESTATEPTVTEPTVVATPVEKSNARRARFEIKRTKDDRFVFNLYAANQVIVATSQIYSSSQSALNGIKSIIANAERAAVEDQTLKEWTPLGFPKWEIYLDNAKQYRFRLDAPNGSCIVHSQGYTSKASCKNGIDSIIRNAKDALVDKAYLIKKDEEK